MSSFWEKIGGRTWRPDPEPPVPPEQTEPEESARLRKRVPRYLADARSLVFARLHRLILRKRRKKRRRQSTFVRLREAAQLGTLQMLAPAKDPQTEIYARAAVENAELTECYTYDQEISRNASKTTRGRPTGHIKLDIPYDGHKYFTRQARADIESAAKDGRIKPDTEAVIGHLLLTNYGNTDLDTMLDLSDRYGAVPIRVPVGANGSTSRMDHLTSDRQTCVIAYDYAPSSQRPRLHPIDVQIELLDPDSLGSLPLEFPKERHDGINDIIPSMTQQVNFRPYLWLLMTVSLHLPCKSRDHNLRPKITKMSLDWPTITSLDALSLTVSGNDVPLRYNPETRSLEWSDLSIASADDDPDDTSDIQLYRNSKILLVIKQPGELYQQPSLDGQVEVEVPGYLMSGLECRLYGATGSLSRITTPKLVCKISTRIHLILDDAFAKRTFSPWQHLYFDEIVPEEARIRDIVTALEDRGFLIESQTLLNDRQDLFLVARRREGPDFMIMWLLIERRRYQTERANKVPGGHTYKSVFESGELRVFIRGTLPETAASSRMR